MLAAVAQICSTPSISRNISICTDVIRRSAASGAKIVYLPEGSDFIAPTPHVLSLSTRLGESTFVQAIRDEAQNSGVWVGVGIHEVAPSNDQPVFNTQLLIDPQGEIKGRYEKLHLFDVDIQGGTKSLESKTTKPGRKLVPPVNTPIGKMGMLTCYDLRFPEPSLLLRKQGAQILTYPAAFTMRTGEAHWEVLLRARAIETQCYVLAPAQVGEHFPGSSSAAPGSPKPIAPRTSYGKAMVVDPWGTVVAKCIDDPAGQHEEGAFCIADIDLDWLERVRRDMPLWEQRREDVYDLKPIS